MPRCIASKACSLTCINYRSKHIVIYFVTKMRYFSTRLYNLGQIGDFTGRSLDFYNSLIRFLMHSTCSGVKTSSPQLGHLSALTLCRTTPSTSKSNSVSLYSLQQTGQRSALAFVNGLLDNLFSKLFSPNFNFS